MSNQKQSGAGEPENLNLHPIYNFDENPHMDHEVEDTGRVRSTDTNQYLTWWCHDCDEVFVVRESWEHLQKRHPEGNYLRE